MTTDTAAEKKTLPEVLADLQNRFGIDHVMVVSDRGLVSPENLEFLSRQGFRYLLGIAGRRGRESASVLAALSEARWEQVDPNNRVQEVRLPGVPPRYFVIDRAERKACEEALRVRDMGRGSFVTSRPRRNWRPRPGGKANTSSRRIGRRSPPPKRGAVTSS